MIASGARLGPYEILSAIGAGGMGEVYRAHDAKLNRDVAIKVLPAALASDPERLARFKREAQVLASLNHPNIAHVYGFETATLPDGSTVHFLAMELVEGADLAERLRHGAIPVDETIAIAKQIAEGLEEAHEHGIIHRDLKPANVKVTPDSKVKILDFGLAKAFEGERPSSTAKSQLSHSPTMSRHATEAGLILGSAAYMSPEQARGKAVDKRADIWSFGVMVYEMLTGKRLFSGETVSDVLAAVLTREPDLGALPPPPPAQLRQLLRRCLERNPRDRLHDIADARLVPEDALGGRADEALATSAVGAPQPSRQHTPWPQWLFGIALGAVALATLDRTLLSPGSKASALTETLRLEVVPPAGTISSGPFDLAPDGRSIVFVAADSNNATALYLRWLDTLEARRLPGTQGAELPFFSPTAGRSGSSPTRSSSASIWLAAPLASSPRSPTRAAGAGDRALSSSPPKGVGRFFASPKAVAGRSR